VLIMHYASKLHGVETAHRSIYYCEGEVQIHRSSSSRLMRRLCVGEAILVICVRALVLIKYIAILVIVWCE